MPENNDINQSLEGIKQAILGLAAKIEDQDKKIAVLELFLQGPNTPLAKQNATTPPITEKPKPAPSFLPPVPNIKTSAPASTAMTEGKIDKKENQGLEEKIAGGLFAKIGVAVLVIGLSLFLKYAFDNNWIGETGRVIMGIIAGLVLIGIGEKYIRQYFNYSQIITGGGLAFLYLSIYAAYDFYQLIPQAAAFLAMIVVTTTGILLSLRYNALHLAVASLLGGFLTPFLVSSGENNMFSLFTYVFILDIAILVLSFFKKWRELNIIGFAGTIIIFISWGEKFYEQSFLWPTIFFLTLFFFVYSVSCFIYNLAKKETSTGIEQVMTILAGIFYFSACYGLLQEQYDIFMGFFAFLLALYYFLWAYTVRMITPNDENLYQFLAFLTIGFITLAVPLQFDFYIITLAWSMEAVLLMVLATRTKQKPIFILAFAVSALALARLVFIDSQMALNDPVIFFNKRFFTFIFVVIASYLASGIFYFEDRTSETAKKLNYTKIMASAILIANLLTILSVSQEINTYYERQVSRLYASENKLHASKPYTTPVASNYKRSAELSKASQAIQSRGSIALSLFWLAYAVILLVIGFAGRFKPVRLGGIALMSLAIVKLFFVDLWSLGTLYRIVSSICLGVVLLAISFIYQKYKNIIKENII